MSAISSPGNKDCLKSGRDAADVSVVVFSHRFGMAFHCPQIGRYQRKQIHQVKDIEAGGATKGSNSSEGVIQS
jgi:hypothetical protein